MVRWEEMIPWFPEYFISDDGRIIGRRGYELNPAIDRNGYVSFYTCYNHKREYHRVNRVVCWHFNGPYPNDGQLYEAAHLDCNPSNNNYWNLEWQTKIQNMNNPITRARLSQGRREWWARREVMSGEVRQPTSSLNV
jgi:hypothetical protein